MTVALPDPPDLDPATLAGSDFTKVRKGFEPAEVQRLLGRIADALRTWQARDAQLVERMARLEEQLERSEELDEQRITDVLGEETARIVKAAREAAAEIRSKAEDHAAKLLRESEEVAAAAAAALTGEAAALRDEATRLRDDALEEAGRLRSEAVADVTSLREEAEAAATSLRDEAQAEATRTRDDAEAFSERIRTDAQARHDELLERAGSVLEERTAEAEAVATGIREAAEAELSTARAEGERIRAEAREAAQEEIERARAEGRDMVAEARDLRERMLRDLAERRRTARRQIEAARAGRDRIVESLRTVGASVDAAVDDLNLLDEDVRRSADLAAAAVDDDIDAVVAELESGLVLGGPGSLRPEPEPEGVAAAEVEAEVEAEVGAVEAEVAQAGAAEAVEVETVEAEVVEAVEVEATEVVESVEVPTTEVEAVPAAAGAPAEGEVVADVVVADLPLGEPGAEAGDEDQDGPGATVHDLFERIRAERVEAGLPEDLTEETEAVSVGEAAEGPTPGVGSGEGAEPAEETGPPAPAGVPTASGALALAPESRERPEGDVEPAPAEAAVADPLGAALDRRDELLGGVERSIGRSLKRLVSDEQNEVLDRLRRIRKGHPELEQLLPSDGDVDRYVEALREDLTAAAAAGGTFWAQSAGTAEESLLGDDPGLEEVLRVRVAELLGRRRAHLQRTLDDADAAGFELADLGDRLRAAYRDWRTTALPELAGDLAIAGFAQGLRTAAGPGTPWCWVPDNGGLPCADAEDNSLAGPLPCGEEFPTGDVLPPAHPGCRCILIPAPQ